MSSSSRYGSLISKLVISILLGGVFAWIVARGGVPLIPPKEGFRQIVWWTVPLYMVSLLLMQFFRASRFRFLIRPLADLPLSEVIAVNWIGFFAIFILPFRLGEFARPALTKLRSGVSVSAGLGTVAVERVIDGLITSVCVAWALFALPRSATNDSLARHVPYYGYLSLALFVAALIALAMFSWQRELASRWTHRIVGLFSKRMGELLAKKVSSMADGLHSLGNMKLAVPFVFESLLYWLLNALGIWMLGWGCGLPLTLGHSIAVMGILAIGILLPAGPGLFGNFQLAVSAALKLYLSESLVGTQGATFIFLMYVSQAVLITLTGVIPLYAMRVRVSDLIPESKVRTTPSEPS